MPLRPLLFLLCFPLFSFALNQEGRILLDFKRSVDAHNNAFSSWHDADPNPCSWYGIICDVDHHVISLDLPSSGISAPFPVHLCNLPLLLYVSLYNNSFHSLLPPDLVNCTNLEYLDLGQNLLTGSLPPSLADMPNLRYLDLSGNNFSGEIPPTFARFQKLEAFSLILNLMGGVIPPFLGNITTLRMLNLSYNSFEPGRIPPELGNLVNLEVLWLTGCNLQGEIPDSLGRLKNLVLLDLSINNLSGSFPPALTELTHMSQIELFSNSLSGALPDGLSKLKSLRLVDISMNKFSGPIPSDLFELPLESLNAFENKFEGSLPESMGRSRTLTEVKLFSNRFTGALPGYLGKYSPLESLDISNNFFSGRLPEALCENGKLLEIMMINNFISGELPSSLGDCHSLTRIRLGNNNLTGHVPENLWGLPGVVLLELANNSFSGPISKNIANSKRLSLLLISNNKFSGTIPEELGSLENLVEFAGANNKFVGNFPESLTKIHTLAKLNLKNNMLSGLISSRLDAWKRLNELNLANNNFSGQIPREIANLPVLNYLDLSGNQFSGEIPYGLQNTNLNVLNLSYNHLNGTLPSYFESEVYRNSFLGNPDLCRDGNGACRPIKSSRRGGDCDGDGVCIWMMRSVFVSAGVIFFVGMAFFHVKYKKFLASRSLNMKSKWTMTSFQKLSFSQDEIVGSLDEHNVIGSGGSGQVYKVALTNGSTIAVKKLWPKVSNDRDSFDLEKVWSEDDVFDAEVEILGNIRHKNIVKLLCCCSNGVSKLLVYEYMPNGSLGDMLHDSRSALLDWPTRYKIALDVAEGLSYLHHDCVPPIIHRDIKSNNILLDADFGAMIADFGIAMAVDLSEVKSMSVVTGSYGYIAPEYAYSSKVNEKGDIFSYGMVILELITGRRPTDPEFEENGLVKWVCSSLEKEGMKHIVDPKLDWCHMEEMLKVLNIGLQCSSPQPVNRPAMRRVVKLLEEVRMDSHPMIGGREGRLKAYCLDDVSESENVV
ncbi:receptor-like protein kinase HSL1 isoform X1 [Cucurbita moschata]|uniref:non-specific serine/threonine protein kinase n=1 Tax=Cucurbita moschata TaxID=3662 RepID=A0A6J1ECK2_CUCMO|nr:receptor-like protein kinase HSL1 isoform X1 [Cucurbita moschata]